MFSKKKMIFLTQAQLCVFFSSQNVAKRYSRNFLDSPPWKFKMVGRICTSCNTFHIISNSKDCGLFSVRLVVCLVLEMKTCASVFFRSNCDKFFGECFWVEVQFPIWVNFPRNLRAPRLHRGSSFWCRLLPGRQEIDLKINVIIIYPHIHAV